MSIHKPKIRPDGKIETRGRKRNTIHSKLSRKQELFVKELVSQDGQITMREAAINAGYPDSSAHARAWELTNEYHSPHILQLLLPYPLFVSDHPQGWT